MNSGWLQGEEVDDDLVRRALAGEPAARRNLVLRLTPVVKRRAVLAWAICRGCRGRALSRHDVLDLTQQVLLLLFDRDARILRSWDPSRGLSLSGFVGLVAEREAIALLRTGRRSAWAETPTSDDILEQVAEPTPLDQRLFLRDELVRIWHCVEQQLSPRGLALFRALLVEEQPIEQVALEFAMSTGALYTFRSRLRRHVHDIRRRLWAAAVDAQPMPRVAGAKALRGMQRRAIGGNHDADE